MAASGYWLFGQYRSGQFDSVISLAFIQCVKEGLLQLTDTGLGSLLCAPFATVVTPTILAREFDLELLIRLSACLLAFQLCTRTLMWIDRAMERRTRLRHQSAWRSGVTRVSTKPACVRGNLFNPTGGALGAMVWRQLLGVKHFLGSVLFSLAVPMVFALASTLGQHGGLATSTNVDLDACFLVILLAASGTQIRFSPRSESDLCIESDARVTAYGRHCPGDGADTGDLNFQLATLVIAMTLNPFSPGFLLVAMAVLLPFNVFIYALENLIFLLYPYRLAEESVRIFLRAILAFTAKGLLLGIVAAIGLGLMLLSILVVNRLPVADIQSAGLVLFSNRVADCWFVGERVLGLAAWTHIWQLGPFSRFGDRESVARTTHCYGTLRIGVRFSLHSIPQASPNGLNPTAICAGMSVSMKGVGLESPNRCQQSISFGSYRCENNGVRRKPGLKISVTNCLSRAGSWPRMSGSTLGPVFRPS